jgi:hypothetical protein
VRRLRPKLLQQKNWLLNHNTPPHTYFFTRERLTKNNMTVITMHPTFLFPPIKTKLKGHHFDTTEVIEAESKALLNSLTEHDFPEAFKTPTEVLETVHMRGRELLQG